MYCISIIHTYTVITPSVYYTTIFQNLSHYRRRGWGKKRQTCPPAEEKKKVQPDKALFHPMLRGTVLHRSMLVYSAIMYSNIVLTRNMEICVSLFLWTFKFNQELSDSSGNEPSPSPHEGQTHLLVKVLLVGKGSIVQMIANILHFRISASFKTLTD